MSRRRKIITLLGCSVLLIATVLIFHRDPEPIYNGRSLTEWMAAYNSASTTEETNEAVEGIRHIGTNALPHLLKWIKINPSSPGHQWLARINHGLMWLNDKVNTTSVWYIHDRDMERAFAAPKTFGLLGKQAAPAVPELTRLLNSPKNHWMIADNAAEVLALMGETGLPALMATLNSTNETARVFALSNLEHLGTNAMPVLPLLIRMLADGTVLEAPNAARILGDLAIEPTTVIPALVLALASTSAATSTSSAQALGSFGKLARPAISALTNLFSCQDQTLRTAATNALHAIDPTTYTNLVSAW